MRLIDADALQEKLDWDNDIQRWTLYGIDDLDEMPAIDPETLRPTGRWVMKETMIRSPYAKNAYCSECLEETGYSYNYCPNCGAKMEE